MQYGGSRRGGDRGKGDSSGFGNDDGGFGTEFGESSGGGFGGGGAAPAAAADDEDW